MSAPLRVIVVHNAYQQRGGEDAVVADEVALLRSRGHAVELYLRNNDDVDQISRSRLAAGTLWSRVTLRELGTMIESFVPDIIHAHNTFPLISPSVYWAASRARVPIVQTLHNFRLLCLNALLLRASTVCEDCVGRLPWRGIVRKCYRESATASATLASMLSLHRALRTYDNKITRYIALNEFCRRKFIEAGLPAKRICVKPNFVDFAPPPAQHRTGLLFVGRLSAEKGVATLSEALSCARNIRLRVAGEGPEAARLASMPGVTRLGLLSQSSVRTEMASAMALVVPSLWYENFPRSIVEAFACGLPVIASRIGALAEIVTDNQTGLLFEPGDPRDLAQKMTWALANPVRMAEMGQNARAQYEREFSAEVNYMRLIEIYEQAASAQTGSRSGKNAEVMELHRKAARSL